MIERSIYRIQVYGSRSASFPRLRTRTRRRNGSSVDAFRCLAALAASGVWAVRRVAARGDTMSSPTILLPFQPSTMSTAQLAAVSYLARYAGRTHALYVYQLRQWFTWCETNGLDPLVGIQRAHVELYIRQLGDRPLMDSSSRRWWARLVRRRRRRR